MINNNLPSWWFVDESVEGVFNFFTDPIGEDDMQYDVYQLIRGSGGRKCWGGNNVATNKNLHSFSGSTTTYLRQLLLLVNTVQRWFIDGRHNKIAKETRRNIYRLIGDAGKAGYDNIKSVWLRKRWNITVQTSTLDTQSFTFFDKIITDENAPTTLKDIRSDNDDGNTRDDDVVWYSKTALLMAMLQLWFAHITINYYKVYPLNKSVPPWFFTG